MKIKVLILLVLLATFAEAQLTKVFETSVNAPSSKLSVAYAYDAEDLNNIYNNFYTFVSGSEVKILNLKTHEIDYSFNVAAYVDTTAVSYASISCYKNFFKSDGTWSCLVKPNSNSETMKIVHNGTAIPTDVKNSMYAEVRAFEGNLYVVSKMQDKVEVFLVRNDLPQTSAIPYESSYISALKKMSDARNEKLFNAIGQKIDDSYYGTLPDYLKKTIYAK